MKAIEMGRIYRFGATITGPDFFKVMTVSYIYTLLKTREGYALAQKTREDRTQQTRDKQSNTEKPIENRDICSLKVDRYTTFFITQIYRYIAHLVSPMTHF